jgi:hypothetical protein
MVSVGEYDDLYRASYIPAQLCNDQLFKEDPVLLVRDKLFMETEWMHETKCN